MAASLSLLEGEPTKKKAADADVKIREHFVFVAERAMRLWRSLAQLPVVLFQVGLLPAQRSEFTGAVPRVVGEGEVGDGAKPQAFGEGLKLVVVQVQRLDCRHTSESTVRELRKK